MNIAFIHTIFPGGGAERISRDIASALGRDGKYRFYVFAQKFIPEALTRDYSCHFAALETYPIGKEETRAIECLVKKHRIDAIVLISRRLHDIEGFRRRAPGCKVIFANHGEAFHLRYEVVLGKCRTPFKAFLWRLYRRRLYEDWGYAMFRAKCSCRRDYLGCDRYVVLCEEYKRIICEGLHLEGEKNHIVVINNPETPVENVCLDKEKIVLFSGRLDQFSKRVDRLLRIWKRVSAEAKDWRLIIAGDGADGGMLREMASQLKLERTEFIGYQSDMSPFYRKASILCLTSQSEGWGLCLTEAQANGVIPMAFSATGGIREILSPDGENGILVTPFDEDEYARRLLELILAPEEKKMRLRRNVLKKAASYSPAATAKKWKVLFDNV